MCFNKSSKNGLEAYPGISHSKKICYYECGCRIHPRSLEDEMAIRPLLEDESRSEKNLENGETILD